MKENYFFYRKILLGFHKNIMIRTYIMSFMGFLIVIAVNTWRFNPLAYIIVFLICFGINFFLFFRKKEVINEFKKDQ